MDWDNTDRFLKATLTRPVIGDLELEILKEAADIGAVRRPTLDEPERFMAIDRLRTLGFLGVAPPDVYLTPSEREAVEAHYRPDLDMPEGRDEVMDRLHRFNSVMNGTDEVA